ncbi:hypothetical protein Gogos_003276 [Gossypium gossypioides]|uniref:Aminotransferase-like plant mobile domain-containing protein n=1 Tax=Gossypium gossypioides TaxID=34282 RepID=A0A7J9CLJ0_GOSGO|nr:hypothetical protein [Gossypium gossypioides]
MGSRIISDKVTTYQSMLGKVPNKFNSGRILINWLEDNFDELLKDLKDRKEEVSFNRWLSTPTAVVGLVATIIFTSQGDRPIYDLIGDKWNHGSSYVGLPEVLEDIRLLLDQLLSAEFEWMSYTDIDVISYILLKVLRNRWMRDANVPFIVYATVEIHESDRVLRQFGWRQRIPSPPQDLKDLHKMDMRGKDNIDWSVGHKVHIEVCNRRMQSIPIREQFFSTNTTIVDDYLAWFRAIGKPYLLSLEERSRQIRAKRSHRPPQQTSRGCSRTTSSSSALAEDARLWPLNIRVTSLQVYIGLHRCLIPHTTPLHRCGTSSRDNRQLCGPALSNTPPDAPLVVRPIIHRNPLHDRQPPSCGTHSP